MDAATIEFASDRGPKYNIAADSANSYDNYIYGTLGWDKIKDNEDDWSYTLYKQGRTTGRSSGWIKDVDDIDKVFTLHADRAGGDSGGPHYRVDDSTDYAYIAGIHNWDHGGSTSAGALYIGRVENQLGIYV